MAFSDKPSSIERLRKNLYSRKGTQVGDIRHDVHIERTAEVQRDWSWPENQAPKMTPGKIYKGLLIFSLIVFVAALSFAAYTFFSGRTFISSDNVDVTVDGPVTVAGGDPVQLTVSVQNKNKTDIQLADLIVNFPAGAKDPSDMTKDLGQQLISLGSIKAGEVLQHPISVVFFGSQGAAEDIKFTIQYHTADSNAVFYKEKDVTINVGSSPISVAIQGLDTINSGEPTTLVFTVNSNSTNIIQNLALSLSYPFGWTTLSSNPAPSSGNNTWNIGDLPPGATTTISMTGTIDGEDGDQRTVSATVGTQSTTGGGIAVAMASSDHTFTLEKPFLDATVSFSTSDTGTGNYAVTAGKIINATIHWVNNSASRITDADIVASFSGDAFDPTSVNTDSGYYNSQTDSIDWNGGRNSALSVINPGDSGDLHFSFASLPQGVVIGTPSMSVDVAAKGNRIDETNASEEVSTESIRQINIISNLSLSSRALRSGVIQNGGVFPPHVNQATDYTIEWTAANTSNAVSGVVVTGTLPPYVSFTNNFVPAGANISYASTTGLVTWNVGTLAAGVTSQIDFQIALTPSANQAGSTPVLLQNTQITGTDDVANVTLQNSEPDLTTTLSSDPGWITGNDVVQR